MHASDALTRLREIPAHIDALMLRHAEARASLASNPRNTANLPALLADRARWTHAELDSLQTTAQAAWGEQAQRLERLDPVTATYEAPQAQAAHEDAQAALDSATATLAAE